MTSPSSISHTQAALDLAKKESAEHMEGMAEAYQEMRKRPLRIKAYTLNDPNAPSTSFETKAKFKTVHFVRHGQGFHNLMADLARENGKEWIQFQQSKENPYVMPEILDAPLTEKGRNQARALQPQIKSLEHQPQLIITSPNCRAIQTALIAFESSLSRKIPFVAHEMVKEESGVHICDKRRPKTQQQYEFPQVDFSMLTTEEDPIFDSEKRETKLQVADRVYNFLEWLSSREDVEHVGVASHSGWLLCLLNAVCESDESSKELKQWWMNGEMRSVKLEFCRNDEC